MYYKFVIIANGQIKSFFHYDEVYEAVEAYKYISAFYHDATLNIMKYSYEGHCINLTEFKIPKGEEYVYSNSRQ